MSTTTDLAALSEAATPGTWGALKGVEASDDMRCGITAKRGNLDYLVATIENGAPGDFCDTEYANAAFIVALVNEFRAGRLVQIDREGMRERVAKDLCLAMGDDPDREGPWLEWWEKSAYGVGADAAIAAMLGDVT